MRKLKTRQTILAAACLVLAAALSFAGCTTDAPDQGSDSSAVVQQADADRTDSQTSPRRQNQATHSAAPKPPADLADRLPYIGMPTDWIDSTYLGTHESREKRENGTILYRWYSRNGKHDAIFGAYCKDGAVINVVKFLDGTDYWPGLVSEYPDYYAEGIPEKPIVDEKPDPADYDDEDDYVSASEDWYREHGTDDTDAEATEDWDANGDADGEWDE